MISASRRDRQHVRDQLRMRRAEEQEDECAPDQQHEHRREAAAGAASAAHGGCSAMRPTATAGSRPAARARSSRAAWAVLFRGQVPAELLDDEEEVEELGVALLDEHEPRRDDREEDHEAAHQVQALPQRPVARDQRIEHEHGAGEDQADEALRQHRERHCGPACPHPAACRGRAQPAARAAASTATAPSRTRLHVERVEVAHQVPVRRRREHDGGEEARQRVEQARAGVADQQDAGEARDGRRGAPAIRRCRTTRT